MTTEEIYVDDVYPSRFITGKALPDEGLKVRVHQVTREDLTYKGTTTNKIILHLANHDQDMALNKTQANTMGTLFGEPASKWVGEVLFIVPEVMDSGQKTIKIFKAGGPDQEPPEAPPVDIEQQPPEAEELEEVPY